MFKQFEFVSSVFGAIARHFSGPAARHAAAQSLVDKFEEFVRRVRRAGLFFIAAIVVLLVLSLGAHPLGLLLWLVALPLAAFSSALSMLWPTRGFASKRAAVASSIDVFGSATAWLVRKRGDLPMQSRSAFDLVLERVRRIEALPKESSDILLSSEAERLVTQHLPRLIRSFLALPPLERTDGRIHALTDGLLAIADELSELSDQLLASIADRFEIERRFIENRYSQRSELAGA